MADIIVKNRYGEDVSHNGAARIRTRTADGGTKEFRDVDSIRVEPLEIAENGTYTAPESVDGYNPVTVAVPEPVLQEKTITENGEYTADNGFDGLLKVLVNVAGAANIVKRGSTIYKDTGAERTITHNFGVIPDIVMFFQEGNTTGTGVIFGFATSRPDLFDNNTDFRLYKSGSTVTGTSSNSEYYADTTMKNGWVGMTDTKFTLPVRPATDGQCRWIAIAGLP